MGIEALGYIGVRAKDLGDWASYGANFLGLQRIDKSRSTLAFRMDDRKQRLVVDADGGQRGTARAAASLGGGGTGGGATDGAGNAAQLAAEGADAGGLGHGSRPRSVVLKMRLPALALKSQ